MARFLQEFQKHLGFSCFPLREQFDLIIGSNIGMFMHSPVNVLNILLINY